MVREKQASGKQNNDMGLPGFIAKDVNDAEVVINVPSPCLPAGNAPSGLPAGNAPPRPNIVSCYLESISLWCTLKVGILLLVFTCACVIGRHFCMVVCGTLDEVGQALTSSAQSIAWWLPMFSFLSHPNANDAKAIFSTAINPLPCPPHSTDLAVPVLKALGPPKQLLALGPFGAAIAVAWTVWSQL